MNFKLELLTLMLVVLNQFASAENPKATDEASKTLTKDPRKERLLFSVVSFPNSPCSSKDDPSVKGVCFTNTECQNKNGFSSGNCASGFGVCCMFFYAPGETITQNCSYIQSPGYPEPLSNMTTEVSYIVIPTQSDICQLRLDFLNFVTSVTKSATVPIAGSCIDKFAVTSLHGFNVTNICGTNTNQHMYFETGMSTDATNIDFEIDHASKHQNRTWKIKITQIECSNLARAPPECRQYFTGLSGSVMTYNFGQMLTDQMYTNCFRQEEGYCHLDFNQNTTTTPDPFLLGSTDGIGLAGTGNDGCAGNNMITALVMIPSDSGIHHTFCGSYLVNVIGDTTGATVRQLAAPFTMRVFSTSSDQKATTGFSLVYSQVPC